MKRLLIADLVRPYGLVLHAATAAPLSSGGIAIASHRLTCDLLHFEGARVAFKQQFVRPVWWDQSAVPKGALRRLAPGLWVSMNQFGVAKWTCQ